MSKTSTTTLLIFTILLHLATTTISTHVSSPHPKRARLHNGHGAQGFGLGNHKPSPEKEVTPQFKRKLKKPRKALAVEPHPPSGLKNADEPKGQTRDHKPTTEKNAPPRFTTKPVKPGINTTPEEKKLPPRFTTKPVKPERPEKTSTVKHLAKKRIPPQHKRKKPVPPAAGIHKKKAPTTKPQPQPQRHLIRRAQTPTPPTPAAAGAGAGGKRWCVAKEDTSDKALRANIDYACRKGVDCKAIKKGGDCYDSKSGGSTSSLRSRASYVMNAFYNINGRKDFNCNFGRTAVLTSTNPSYGKCIYV